MDFNTAFERVIHSEGGYVDDSRDPGLETKFGISKRAYPQLDIKALTLADAKVIYRRDYWQRCRCDELPEGVAFDMFDAAVNSGPGQAIRWLQRAVGVADDGVLGPLTLAAVRRLEPGALRARYSGIRLDFMTQLSTWDAFGKGWARRIAANLREVT
ncbi:MAG: glycoside hydrolase family 108 protein [Proteobacteria bacterium]|nr:glycoside hydrolase family 108 protein [Pseudomonadota bacterium]